MQMLKNYFVLTEKHFYVKDTKPGRTKYLKSPFWYLGNQFYFLYQKNCVVINSGLQ